MTAEGIPFERDTIDTSITVTREFMRGPWAYSNIVASPWGRFRMSDELVITHFSIGYHGGPQPRPGDPALGPTDVARTWLNRHRPDLVAIIDRGLTEFSMETTPSAAELRYTRRRSAAEVSVFPLEFSVTVLSSCHCVESFWGGERDFARTVAPQLDEAAARDLIQQRYARVSIDRLDLVEQLTESGSRTVYVARLTVAIRGIHDTHPHVLWVFDADTGETIERFGDPTEANIERPLPAGVSP
ncbi:MAG: hypothetical protein R3B40_19230 [Polyangiales bacterium]|nr:hypothetical protein [Myxococcales bacterium]MCB9660863.1 hypothetical protein [Sandaracinaceae bacterium]